MSSISIGRREDCDIIIEDESASRLHAELIRDGNRLFIRDKNSTNGTLISRHGKVLDVEREVEVYASDKLSFGDSRFFLLEDLLKAFTDRLYLKLDARIEVRKKKKKEEFKTRTVKVAKYRCHSCGAIVSTLNDVCDSCLTKL